jgi:hypothetical protein
MLKMPAEISTINRVWAQMLTYWPITGFNNTNHCSSKRQFNKTKESGSGDNVSVLYWADARFESRLGPYPIV